MSDLELQYRNKLALEKQFSIESFQLSKICDLAFRFNRLMNHPQLSRKISKRF